MIRLFIVTLMFLGLAACGGEGDSSTGGGQSSLVSATATDQSTVNIDLNDADIDVIEVDAQDEAQVNIDNGVADPTIVTAIPVEGGIDGSSLGLDSGDTNPCTNGGTLSDGTQLSPGSFEERCGGGGEG